MTNLQDATVLVTGANDLVGLHLLTTLKRLGVNVIGIGDLHADLGSLQYLDQQIRRFKPEYVFYVPSERHGIAVHRQHPGGVYYESVILFAHLLEAARETGVQKVVNVLSNCVYPANAPVPHQESEIWNGLPDKLLVPYGMGRRISIVHSAAYYEEYGLRTISLILASAYGSNDNFDPHSSQVMASMIRRFVEAKQRGDNNVVCWGDGAPTREFIHIRDAVHAIIEAVMHYDANEPLNIGSEQEISIKDLANRVAQCVGYEGHIDWDTTKPGGRSRVCLDSSRMRALLPPWELVDLSEGVKETAEWFSKTNNETINPRF
ncbi:MAG: NAD-dependent epimerase/dehydratase family protein [Gammaproteobacteria bacterium]|nr:NAD-dependent epimerase/dehydratase family protein [Gammaproteobacteria bacterium]